MSFLSRGASRPSSRASFARTLASIAVLGSISTSALAAEGPPPRLEEGRPATADEPSHKTSSKKSADDGVEVGALLSAGFPRPLGIEGFVGVDGWLLLGGEYSVLPKISASGADVTLSALAADVRLLPFDGPFFVGARVGRQHLRASATLSYAGTSVSESLDVDTWFVNPRLGLLFRFRPGLTVGMDAGLQIPVSSSSSTTLPAAVASATDVTRVSDALGKSVIPTVNVLEVGLVF